jgi:membrane-associated phospholipid phosphatase
MLTGDLASAPPMNSWQDKLAWWLSSIFSPFVCVPYFCCILVAATVPDPQRRLLLSVLSVFFAIGVPALYIAWQVYTGKITDMHVANKDQRDGPFRSGQISIACLLVVYWLLSAPVRLSHFALVMWIQSFLFERVTRYTKISLHTGVLAAFLSAAIEIADWPMHSLLWILPVAWARIHRGRHLPSQVAGGAVLGYAISCGVLRFLA